MRRFTLKWEGWCYEGGLPSNKAGIYCVWAALITKKTDGSVTIFHKDARLIYIGESGDIANRVSGHGKKPCWEKQRKTSESIVFTYTLLPTSDVSESWRLSVENCLIATHLPPCNDDDLEYHFEKTVDITNTGVTFGKLKDRHKCKGSNDPDDK